MNENAVVARARFALTFRDAKPIEIEASPVTDNFLPLLGWLHSGSSHLGFLQRQPKTPWWPFKRKHASKSDGL